MEPKSAGPGSGSAKPAGMFGSKRTSSLGEDSFLSVPKKQPVTASSSAETLTDNTLTAPPTPPANNPTEAAATAIRKDSTEGDSDPDKTPVAKTAPSSAAALRDDPPPAAAPAPVPTAAAASSRHRHSSASAHALAAVNAAAASAAAAGPAAASPRTRARSTSTFSSASYTFHNAGAGGGLEEVDGSDCIAARPSRSQPCSHHPSFSNASGSRYFKN